MSQHRRRPRARILLAVVALALGGCAAEQTPSPDADVVSNPTFAPGSTMAELAAEGTITIGTKFDQPLFGKVDPTTGDPAGFDVEIAKIVAAELGIPEDKITWVEARPIDRERLLEEGTVDLVVATYTITEERKDAIAFAGPYYEGGQSFFVPKGNPAGFTTDPDQLVASLKSQVICTVKGSTSEQHLRDYTQNIITVDTYGDCIVPLREGQVNAISTDAAILAGLATEYPDEFEVVTGTFTTDAYGIGLRHGDDEFRGFLNDTLEKAYGDGRWEAAWMATIGNAIPVPAPPAVERY